MSNLPADVQNTCFSFNFSFICQLIACITEQTQDIHVNGLCDDARFAVLLRPPFSRQTLKSQAL